MIPVTCQNIQCKHYLKEKGKDIIKYGKNRAGHQLYKCLHCNHFFTETKLTPIYRKRLSEEEITRISKLLVEKNGIRSIERITGHHRDTIGRLLEDMAEHAQQVNQTLLRNLNLTQYEMDELWVTVKKNRRKLSVTAQLQLKKVTSTSIQR
ncbi:IS1 family transposase [Candidatus Bathyarchaeota archaeon A05DMB-2]|nr:IS1 family transposase [Candidatus Bathyarchaeota archaeon A05DMB-2]